MNVTPYFSCFSCDLTVPFGAIPLTHSQCLCKFEESTLDKLGRDFFANVVAAAACISYDAIASCVVVERRSSILESSIGNDGVVIQNGGVQRCILSCVVQLARECLAAMSIHGIQ